MLLVKVANRQIRKAGLRHSLSLTVTGRYVKDVNQLVKFTLEWTDDGSPTLRSQGAWDESMHSRAGALSESDYIYAEALREVLKFKSIPQILSVGIGAGYNENIVAAILAGQCSFRHTFRMMSFEIVPELRDNYLNILREEQGSSDIYKVQTQALKMVAEKYNVSVNEIKSVLLGAMAENRWTIADTFALNTQFDETFNCVFFDPFSKNTQPELWAEDQIDRFFESALSPECVFATYAATGDLKRALQRHGFDIIRSKGFAHKKQSTLAVRLGQ